MDPYLSKLLPLFVMPLAVVWFAGLIALLLLIRKKRRASVIVMVFALLVLWMSSIPLTGSMLYAQLESAHRPVPLTQIPSSDCIVLLGGALSPADEPRVDIEMTDAVDRVRKTAELFRTGKAPLVIVSAGNQPWSKSEKNEADLIKELLVEWGVAPEAIFLEGSSRNTRENALYSKNLIQAVNCQRPLLVTSAAHMPRAVAAFDVVGVPVTPVSTDVKVADTNSLTVMDFIPSAGALAMTSDALREFLGRLVYQIRGWA